MRLWSLHPKYLDVKGLTAAWREALLAQAVLYGQTIGYRSHPQLDRFKAQPDPEAAIATYLSHIEEEARRRGYKFDIGKIGEGRITYRIPVTDGQIRYEWDRLCSKLEARDPVRRQHLRRVARPDPHPLFVVVQGAPEPWERNV